MSGARGRAAAAAAVAAPEAAPVVDMTDELQRRKKAAAAAKRRRAAAKAAPAEPVDVTPAPAPAPTSPGAGPALPGWMTDQRGAPDWFPTPGKADPVRAANAGGGFVLGVMLWALGLAYLRGGSAGVKQLLAAKFLNRPTTPTASGLSAAAAGLTGGLSAGRPS